MKMKLVIVILLVGIFFAGCSPVAASVSKRTDIPTSISLDSNEDGLISIEELEAAFVQMHDIVKLIADTQPTVAQKLEKDIVVLEDKLHNNSYTFQIRDLQTTAQEIFAAAQAANEQAAKG